MAHSNISERRASVKALLDLDLLDAEAIDALACYFNCSISTIRADIIFLTNSPTGAGARQ